MKLITKKEKKNLVKVNLMYFCWKFLSLLSHSERYSPIETALRPNHGT
jgi:hypothetical protein